MKQSPRFYFWILLLASLYGRLFVLQEQWKFNSDFVTGTGKIHLAARSPLKWHLCPHMKVSWLPVLRRWLKLKTDKYPTSPCSNMVLSYYRIRLRCGTAKKKRVCRETAREALELIGQLKFTLTPSLLNTPDGVENVIGAEGWSGKLIKKGFLRGSKCLNVPMRSCALCEKESWWCQCVCSSGVQSKVLNMGTLLSPLLYGNHVLNKVQVITYVDCRACLIGAPYDSGIA